MLFIIRCDATSKHIISLSDSSNCESWTEAFKVDLSPHCNSHILMQKGKKKKQQFGNSIVLMLKNSRCSEEPLQWGVFVSPTEFPKFTLSKNHKCKNYFQPLLSNWYFKPDPKLWLWVVFKLDRAPYWWSLLWISWLVHIPISPSCGRCILFEYEFPMRHCDHAVQKSILPPRAGLNWCGFTAANQ